MKLRRMIIAAGVVLCMACLSGCDRIEDAVRGVDWNKAVNDTVDIGNRVAGRVDWKKHFDAVGDLARDVIKSETQKQLDFSGIIWYNEAIKEGRFVLKGRER